MSRTSEHWLHYSQLAAWLECRQKWVWGYIKNLKRRQSQTYFSLGSTTHKSMEHLLLGSSDEEFEQAMEAIKQKQLDQFPTDDTEGRMVVVENCQLGEELARRNYRDIPENWELVYLPEGVTYTKDDDPTNSVMVSNGKVPAVEVRLRCKLDVPGWEGFQGTMDAVLKEKESGLVFVWDHKTMSQYKPKMATTDCNLQFACYQRLLRLNGIETAGSVQNEIKNKLPTYPKLNKNGSMSRVKIASDWETYSLALVANGLDPDDYEDMRDGKLTYQPYIRTKHHRTQEAVDLVWNMIVEPAAFEMGRAIQFINSGTIYPTWSERACQFCSYYDICVAMLNGEDHEFVITEGYCDKQYNPQQQLSKALELFDDFED